MKGVANLAKLDISAKTLAAQRHAVKADDE